eukprot:11213326-Lingulodinium_polyedra.AAC.1
MPPASANSPAAKYASAASPPESAPAPLGNGTPRNRSLRSAWKTRATSTKGNAAGAAKRPPALSKRNGDAS